MERITKKDGNLYKLKPDKEIYGEENGIRLVQIVGNYEDIFELIEEMYKKPVYYKYNDEEETYDYYTHSTILYNPKSNAIEIYEYDFIASYKIEEYGTTWWLRKKENK